MNSNQIYNPEKNEYYSFRVIENYPERVINAIGKIKPKTEEEFFNKYKKILNENKVFYILSEATKSATAAPKIYKAGRNVGIYDAFDKEIGLESVINNINNYLFLKENYNKFLEILKTSINPKFIEKERREKEKYNIEYKEKVGGFINKINDYLKRGSGPPISRYGNEIKIPGNKITDIDDFFNKDIYNYYALLHNSGAWDEREEMWRGWKKMKHLGTWEKTFNLENIFVKEQVGLSGGEEYMANNLKFNQDSVKENSIYVILYPGGFKAKNASPKASIARAEIFPSIDKAMTMIEENKHWQPNYQIVRVNMRVAEVIKSHGEMGGRAKQWLSSYEEEMINEALGERLINKEKENEYLKGLLKDNGIDYETITKNTETKKNKNKL